MNTANMLKKMCEQGAVHEPVGQQLPGPEQSRICTGHSANRHQAVLPQQVLQNEDADVREDEGFVGGCYSVEHRDSMRICRNQSIKKSPRGRGQGGLGKNSGKNQAAAAFRAVYGRYGSPRSRATASCVIAPWWTFRPCARCASSASAPTP